MEGNIFVNEAITLGIQDYLKYKETSDSEGFYSFFVVVIRALVLIYGELDIINPFRTNHATGLGGFDANLKKYGLNDAELATFKDLLMVYMKADDLDKPNAFLKIQKMLVDMLIDKRKHVLVSDDDIKKFKDLIYFKEDTNVYKKDLYDKFTPNSNEIMDYLNSKLYELNHVYTFTEYKENTLNSEAYQLAGYNIVEVMRMQDSEIDNVNTKVYHFFRIKDTDLNKRERLEKAIQYYKKYGNVITSGNGYVDLLLLAGIVATGLMIITIVGIRFMR